MILDRIELDSKPVYVTQGRTQCLLCREWVWMSPETAGAVLASVLRAICRQCATERLHPEVEKVDEAQRSGRSPAPELG